MIEQEKNTMQKHKMTNIQKFKMIESLSPLYSANEIAEMTGLTPSSVYHFRRKYQLPTEKDSDIYEIAITEAKVIELKRKKRALTDIRILLDD